MHGSSVERRESDFSGMVEEMRRSSRRALEVTTPHLRLCKVVDLVQKFVEAVRRANAPRSVFGGSEHGPKKREALRRHREAHLAIRDAEIGLMPLLMRLTALDCTFVFGDAPCFGVNPFVWDSELWMPLSRWAEAGYSLLFGDKDQADWPRRLSPKEFEVWLAEEEAIKQDLLERMRAFLPDDGYPVVDEKRRVVKWRGEELRLGDKTKKAFDLFACLARSKGDPVQHDDICEALDYPELRPSAKDYDKQERRRADLLRTDIHRLRVELRTSKLPQLADAIITTPGHVRLDVSELESPNDPNGPFVNSQENPSFARSQREKPEKSRKRKSS